MSKRTNQIRIIGGQHRGRKLHFPERPGLRPTPDRVRETLFNWLMQKVRGAKCLDLFAGSGALGFEALSRGAKHVTFVDSDKQVITYLKQVLQQFKLTNANVITADASVSLGLSLAPYDIVFLDPPFHKAMIAEVCHWLAIEKIVTQGGLIYIECESTLNLDDLKVEWTLLKQKQAGQVLYSLWQKR